MSKRVSQLPADSASNSGAGASSRGLRWFRLAQLSVFTTLGVAAGAWWVVRQRQNYIDRWTPFDMPFPAELLGVLALPDSDATAAGAPLRVRGNRLLAAQSGQSFAIVDGIPDFGGPQQSKTLGDRLDNSLWFDTGHLFERLGWQPWRWSTQFVVRDRLAGRAAQVAQDGWCLCVPADPAEVLALARRHANTRILCVDWRWPQLLEARRHALAENLNNMYFVRARPWQLPFKRGTMAAIWSADRLPQAPQPQQALAELARVARPGATLAGLTLTSGTNCWHHRWPTASSQRPGILSASSYIAQLADLGVAQLETFQSGAALGFIGVL